MNLTKFQTYLTEIQPALRLWGDFIHSKVKSTLSAENFQLQLSSFRVKETSSALFKVSRKNYSDPIKDMEDLVGVRFVSLVTNDIDRISEVIRSGSDWDTIQSRSFEEEIARNPSLFGYQSLHYILRSKKEFEIDGIMIPKGLACEVQIRTILQHAFAEMTHDTIYKSEGRVPLKATRFASSSMALIETTDHLFCETMRLLKDERDARNQLYEELKSLYSSHITINNSNQEDKRLNLFILDHYRDNLPSNFVDELRYFVSNQSAICKRIEQRIPSDSFWYQPVALLAYWLVSSHPYTVLRDWPLASSLDALELIYSDLGKINPNRN